jgi:signal transduction histidine kinase
MASAEIELQRESRGSWASLKLLPARIWFALLGVLLVTLAAAVAVSVMGSPVALFIITLVDVALIALVARLLIAEALRQEQRRLAAEREAKDMERLIELRTRELSDLSTHLQAFTEKEKSELARNLHDELGGLLTAAKMDLSWMQSRLKDATYEQRLVQLGNVLDEAMDLKRRVVEDLRPSLLEHFGLPTALRAFLESTCTKAGLECEVDVPDNADALPKDVAIALFRVVQEGMTNIIRHASARRVRLMIHGSKERYLLMLSDDGCGMDLNSTRFRWSHGLAGMRHRVRAIGGTFSIESSPADGTTLRVEIPRARPN